MIEQARLQGHDPVVEFTVQDRLRLDCRRRDCGFAAERLDGCIRQYGSVLTRIRIAGCLYRISDFESALGSFDTQTAAFIFDIEHPCSVQGHDTLDASSMALLVISGKSQ